MNSVPSGKAKTPEAVPFELSQARVVFLVNFLAPNHVAVFREVARRVGQLYILCSVAIEANRNWQPDFADLQVVIQKNWTTRRVVTHPGGYEEELFIHFPLDTPLQLNRLKPDCVVSLEMGTRSLLSSLYRRFWNRSTRHVLAVCGSERSEAGRGKLRRMLRRRLIATADAVTYNGPSCRRYLIAQGADPNCLLPWNYAADPTKPYRGEIQGFTSHPLRLLSVSQLITRKGIIPALNMLNTWSAKNADRSIEWAIAGTGPLLNAVKQMTIAPNVKIHLLGHQSPVELQSLYREYPTNFLPTLADEWGLVVDEALASGQLMLGSVHAQAVETLVQPGKNGWVFDPEQPESLFAALDQLASLDPQNALAMRQSARDSVAQRTHIESAEQFLAAVTRAMR